MKRTLIMGLLCAATAWSGGAQSALKNLENAYEVAASAMLLPDASGGELVVHSCPTCAAEFLPTNGDTQYQIGAGGKAMTLADFRGAVRKNPQALCTIIYRLDNKLVTRVTLFVR